MRGDGTYTSTEKMAQTCKTNLYVQFSVEIVSLMN